MKMKKKKELKEVTDFRVDKHKIEYPLHEILFMTLFGFSLDKGEHYTSGRLKVCRWLDFPLLMRLHS